VTEPGGSSPLYRYRPLTEQFIEQRWDALRRLGSAEQAVSALSTCASAYLRVLGQTEGGAEPALLALLERLYEDASSFDFPSERFARVYSEVERTLYAHTMKASVVCPLNALRMQEDRIDISDGLVLMRGDLVDAPHAAVWPATTGARRRDDANVLCVIDRELPRGSSFPVGEARTEFHHILRGLRLFKAGACALGTLAWARADEGSWRAFSLGGTGRARGEPWLLSAADAGYVRDFIARARTYAWPGHVAWAATRFEMGCERLVDTEALSDYLLAMRALLDACDEVGRASLPLRIAALCAEEADKGAVQQRVELALSLERFLMRGGDPNDFAQASAAELVSELEGYLRALLWDTVSGFLSADLKAYADSLLLAGENSSRGKQSQGDALAMPASQSQPTVSAEQPL
jgi:hypothetical protein